MRKNTNNKKLVSEEGMEQIIFIIRKQKVILDSDLAALYGVETKNLNKAVQRNIERFPAEFMFRLHKEETDNLRFQIGTSSYGGRRYLPYVFTEHGALMAANVLNSSQAISMSLIIIRTFIKLRQMLSINKNLAQRLDELERKYDEQFQIIFEVIERLMELPVGLPDEPEKPKIGFVE